jgi:hypothetical protein
MVSKPHAHSAMAGAPRACWRVAVLRLCLVVLIALGCASPPAEPDAATPPPAEPDAAPPPVAKTCEAPQLVCVGSLGITETALKARLDELDPLIRRHTIASRGGALSLFINEALLVQEAKRLGLHARPDVAGKLARYEARVLTRALMETLTAEAIPPDAALRKYYDRHLDRYRGPGLPTVLQARLAQIKSGGVPQELSRGVSAAFKARKSLPALRAQFPEVTFDLFEPGSGRALESAVSNRVEFLQNGEISDRFWVEDEMRIIKVVAIKPGPALPFDTVRAQVEADTRPTRFQRTYRKTVARLKSETPVVRNSALINAMRLR